MSEGAAYGLINVDDAEGDVSIVEEASLFWAAELVSEGDQNAVKKGGYDSVVCVDY